MNSRQTLFRGVSYFSATLADLLREQNLTQAEVAERAEISQGLLSSYLNDQGRPKVDGLTRLCKAFGTEGGRLAMAFLKDEVPPHLKSRIEITEKGGKEESEEPPSLDLKSVSPKLRQFLEDAAQVCERRPKVLDALRSLLDLIGPE